MIIGLIPARSGSKAIGNKNIRNLGGFPLIAWSILASRMASYIEMTVASTNSLEYAEIAKHYGAEVLIRPDELCQDDSPDLAYVRHTLQMLPSVTQAVILRPTTPLRDHKQIDIAIQLLGQNPESTSLRSVSEMSETAYKSMVIVKKMLRGMIYRDLERVNLPRQEYEKTYKGNGYVDIIKRETVTDSILWGDNTYPFITKDVGEIDKEDDFDYIEWRLQKYGSPIYDNLRYTHSA